MELGSNKAAEVVSRRSGRYLSSFQENGRGEEGGEALGKVNMLKWTIKVEGF